MDGLLFTRSWISMARRIHEVMDLDKSNELERGKQTFDHLGTSDGCWCYAAFPNQEVALTRRGNHAMLHYPAQNADFPFDAFLCTAQWQPRITITEVVDQIPAPALVPAAVGAIPAPDPVPGATLRPAARLRPRTARPGAFRARACRHCGPIVSWTPGPRWRWRLAVADARAG